MTSILDSTTDPIGSAVALSDQKLDTSDSDSSAMVVEIESKEENTDIYAADEEMNHNESTELMHDGATDDTNTVVKHDTILAKNNQNNDDTDTDTDAAVNQNSNFPTVSMAEPDEAGVQSIAHNCRPDLQSVLLSKENIARRIAELGLEISHDYKDIVTENEPLLVVGLLRGAFIFLADLVREITIRHCVAFMMVKSYSGTTAGKLQITMDLTMDPAGKHILIVEDLVDTGSTLTMLEQELKSRNCKSVRMCCLLAKRTHRRKANFNTKINYLGFECRDEFIVGYGMDFNHFYRSLPAVACLKPEVFENASEN